MTNDLPRCRICGDYVPEGKELCWVCSHSKKLHKAGEPCGKDSCDINFNVGVRSGAE